MKKKKNVAQKEGVELDGHRPTRKQRVRIKAVCHLLVRMRSTSQSSIPVTRLDFVAI